MLKMLSRPVFEQGPDGEMQGKLLYICYLDFKGGREVAKRIKK